MDIPILTPPMEEELSNGKGDSDDRQQPCDAPVTDKPQH